MKISLGPRFLWIELVVHIKGENMLYSWLFNTVRRKMSDYQLRLQCIVRYVVPGERTEHLNISFDLVQSTESTFFSALIFICFCVPSCNARSFHLEIIFAWSHGSKPLIGHLWEFWQIPGRGRVKSCSCRLLHFEVFAVLFSVMQPLSMDLSDLAGSSSRAGGLWDQNCHRHIFTVLKC